MKIKEYIVERLKDTASIVIEFESYLFAVGTVLVADWKMTGDGWGDIVQRNFWTIVLLFLVFIFIDLALRIFKGSR